MSSKGKLPRLFIYYRLDRECLAQNYYIMVSLSTSQMEKIDGAINWGAAVGCGSSVVATMVAFIGLGAITAGVGAAIFAISSYGLSVAGLVHSCSNVN